MRTLRISIMKIMLLLSCNEAMASTTGTMPWDTGLKTIADSLTGPTAAAVAIIGIAFCGYGLITGMGGEGNKFVKGAFGIGIAISFIVGAKSFLGIFGLSSALM